MSNQDTTTVFEQPTPTTATNNVPNQGSIASQLVGEDKKFKTVDDLAKGKLEADLHIEKLNAALSAKEAELAKLSNTDAKFSQILQEIEQKKTQITQGNLQVPVLGNDEIESLVRNQMTKVEQERTVQQNLEATNTKLNTLFGDKAKDIVESKARELGIGMAELKDLSSKSPTAFFTLIGASDTKPKDSNSNPTGSVNTAANFNSNNKTGTKEYYLELRRKNPTEYYKTTIHEVMAKVKAGELVL